YVELAKVSLSDAQTADGTRRVLGEVFDVLLRLLHPLVPFVTEALWTELTGGESVTIAAWPSAGPSSHNAAASAAIAEVQAVVNAEQERDQVTRKLSTESFLAKAPAEVVASVRDRLTAAETEIERINVALAALPQ